MAPNAVDERIHVGRLTAAGIKALKKPGMYGDGGTLYLNVATKGTKSWIQRISVNGKRRDLGLGSFPTVTLAEARKLAAANRLLVQAGEDPLAAKRRRDVPTFREALLATYEANLPRWRPGRHTRRWLQVVEKYALPVLGDTPVNQITQTDVLRVLTPIWSSKPEYARKLRQRIRATLRWCLAQGHIEVNVAGETIDGALPTMPAVKQHHRTVPHDRVPIALAAVQASHASLSAKLCFRLMVLTASRSGEARGAEWQEVNLKTRVWCIPPRRMKRNVEHLVPLSDAALTVFEQAQQLRDGSNLVFPSTVRPGRTISDNTLSKLLRELGIDAVPHGFRASFRTWAEETTETPHAVMELALAHAVGSAVERAYARSDLRTKRRDLMEAWADYCTRPI